MTTGLFELAIVILFASGFGVLARLLRQPTILAYIFTGIIIGYFGFHIENPESLHLFSQLGVMFLLFLVGLEIDYDSVRLVGKTSLIVGLTQVCITSILGFLIAHSLGFGLVPALYLAICLTFSSTIIVVKLLADKKDLGSLYGRISVGFLLVQDIVAMLVLMVLSSAEGGNAITVIGFLFALLKGIVFAGTVLFIGRTLFPALFAIITASSELLFLVSLAWVLLLATSANALGFSMEIGGFLAGLALANSSEHFQIASRVRPLRDFFIVIFFVLLGYTVTLSSTANLIKPIAVFSLFVLVGNPMIVWAVMGFLGYRKRTLFFSGITVAQISEFGLVVAALGLRVGHIDADTLAIITGVGITTITLSTYMILHANWLYCWCEPFLSFFERAVPHEEVVGDFQNKKHIVLVGGHRIGQSIAWNLPKQNMLIIDFDPEVITYLRAQGFDCLLGDISDPDIVERAQLENAHVVISTSPDFEDNMTLLTTMQKFVRRPKVVLRAESDQDASLLYHAGADYVLLPHFTSGNSLGRAIAQDLTMSILDQLKRRDLLMIQSLRNA